MQPEPGGLTRSPNQRQPKQPTITDMTLSSDLAQRQLDIERWLQQLGRDTTSPPRLASSDASTRRYWRVDCGEESLIVMDEPPALGGESIAPFVDVQRRLRHAAVDVPAIHAVDEPAGLVLLEDLGDATLFHWLPEADPAEGGEKLAQAVDLLPTIAHADFTGLPAFDAPRLRTEMDLLPDWYLDRLQNRSFTAAEHGIWQAACDRIAERLQRMPQVFVHRDYHSRNLMVCGNRLITIDFQDAVSGPLPYDLVSLLRDSYIDWPEPQVEAMQTRFHRLARAQGLYAGDLPQFHEDFAWVAVQRHLKVLGIFARLSVRDGKHDYLGDLPLTWRHLHKALDRLPELADLKTLLADRAPTSPTGQTTAERWA